MPSVAIKTGTLKWFDKDRGFGFILPSDGSQDVFVHISNIESEDRERDRNKALLFGQHVEYREHVSFEGRLQARNVRGRNGAFLIRRD